MIRETVVIRRTLWLALRKQLIGDYGDLSLECEVLLLNDPKMHIVACADGEFVKLTITYNPLDVALDIRKFHEKNEPGHSSRNVKVISIPLHKLDNSGGF